MKNIDRHKQEHKHINRRRNNRNHHNDHGNNNQNNMRHYVEKHINFEDGMYFIPLGGTEEVGRNLNIYLSVKNGHSEAIIVDAGVSMSDSMGIRVVMSSLKAALSFNIIGIVITHGHEDHIGALPYILDKFDKKMPIYCTQFASVLINGKLQDHGVSRLAEIKKVKLNSTFNLGSFQINYITMTHSILEPCAVAITCPGGAVLHTGDWKFDDCPCLGDVPNYSRLRELAREKGLVLICDSTNACENERTPSEELVKLTLDRLLNQHKQNRVFITLFASNVARIAFILEIARKIGKKVCLLGRSMAKMHDAAVESGYFTRSANLVNPEDLRKYKNNEVIILCTGSQGENNAVLPKIAYGLHSQVKIQKHNRDDKNGNVVIFSSRVIPGNEVKVRLLKNTLLNMNFQIIDYGIEKGIHTSGHPSAPEVRDLIDLCDPETLIPIHGDRILINRMREIGENVMRGGKHRLKRIIEPFNGAVISITKREVIGQVYAAKEAIDGKQIVNLNDRMLHSRKIIGEEGVVFITASNKKCISSFIGTLPIDVIKDNDNQLRKEIKDIVHDVLAKNEDREERANEVIQELSHYFSDRFGKQPIISVHLID